MEGTPSRRLFVSYRRVDAPAEAGRLHDSLAATFGAEHVFLDAEELRVGDRWRDKLLAALHQAHGVVVVIGPGWLRAQDEAGRRCLDLEDDWVRTEIATALDRGIPVFPVLVNDATLPKPDWLPEPVRALTEDTQGCAMGHDDWSRDLGELVDQIENLTELRRSVAPASAADWRGYAASVVVALGHIDIRGIKTRRQGAAIRQPIEQLYTPLRAHDLARGDADGAEPRMQPGRVTLREILARHPRLYLEGEAGAGKTTFLRLIATALARDFGDPHPVDGAGNPVEPHRTRQLGLPADSAPPVPLFVRLGGLAASLGSGRGRRRTDLRELLLDHVEEIKEGQAHGVDRAAWEARLAAGTAWLLLDGFDEVAGNAARGRLRDVLADAAAAWPDCRITLTSRPLSAEALDALGFHRVVIDPFGDAEIREFLTRWHDTLLGDDPAAAEAERGALAGAVFGYPDVRRLAGNPVMLTSLCIVHRNEGRLPEGRARVYRAVLGWLSFQREERREAAGRDPHTQFAERAFERLALAMTTDLGGKRSHIGFQDAAAAIEPVVVRWLPARDHPELGDKVGRMRFLREWLEQESIDSGVIQEVPGQELRFWHLTFQEFLAAKALAELGDEKDGDAETTWWPTVRAHLEDPQWHEVLGMLPGCLFDKGQSSVDALLSRIVEHVGWEEEAPLLTHCRLAGLLGNVLAPLSVLEFVPRPETQAAHEHALREALRMFTLDGAARVPDEIRIEAADALGKAGDPRLVPDADNWLPIAPGSDVLLGRYPVTVAEFGRFVDDAGYQQPEVWGAHEGVRRDQGWTEPDEWARQRTFPNRPVTGVSWSEAVAYCNWCNRMRGDEQRVVRLPTKEEWEGAATHPDGEYPWGAEPPDADRANFASDWPEPRVGHPTPVGVYPAGAGPQGHCDLAGNVWEWCAGEGGLDRAIDEGEGRPVRGGSWADGVLSLRSAFRHGVRAVDRFDLLGFRVCVSPSASLTAALMEFRFALGDRDGIADVVAELLKTGGYLRAIRGGSLRIYAQFDSEIAYSAFLRWAADHPNFLSHVRRVDFREAPLSEFDLFLSYNSDDVERVTQVAMRLRCFFSLDVWFDEWSLPYGDSIRDRLWDGIVRSRSVSVFIGDSGIGPWQVEEVEVAMNRKESGHLKSLIPVLIGEIGCLPDHLRNFRAIDGRALEDQQIAVHIAGAMGRGLRDSDADRPSERR